MLAGLIVITAGAVIGWLGLAGTWPRQRAGHAHHAGRTGSALRAGSNPGALPALLGVTFFLVSGWLVFLTGQPRPGGQVPFGDRVVAGLIFLPGVVCVLCYFAVSLCGRPRCLAPPSIRSRVVDQPHDPGQPAEAVRSGAGSTGRKPDPAGAGAALQPGEEPRARFLANRVQGDRGYGGHVLVTSRRVVFEPAALSQAHGGDRWEIPLDQVAAADVAPRGWNPRTGAWRHRLRIRTAAGDVECFVVWRPRAAARLVERARQAYASG